MIYITYHKYGNYDYYFENVSNRNRFIGLDYNIGLDKNLKAIL